MRFASAALVLVGGEGSTSHARCNENRTIPITASTQQWAGVVVEGEEEDAEAVGGAKGE